MLGHGLGDRVDVLQVGGAVRALRRADGDEDHLGVGDRFLDVGGEASGVPSARLRWTIGSRPGSKIGTSPRSRRVDLALVEIRADDVVAGLGEAGAGDEADVTRSNDANPHVVRSVATRRRHKALAVDS